MAKKKKKGKSNSNAAKFAFNDSQYKKNQKKLKEDKVTLESDISEFGWKSSDEKAEGQTWKDYWGEQGVNKGLNPWQKSGMGKGKQRFQLGDEALWKRLSKKERQAYGEKAKAGGNENLYKKINAYNDEVNKAQLYITGDHDKKALAFYEPNASVESMYQRWEHEDDGKRNKLFDGMSEKGQRWLFKGTPEEKQAAKQYKFNVGTYNANNQVLENNYSKLVEKIDNDVANQTILNEYKDQQNLKTYNRDLEIWAQENQLKDEVFRKSEIFYNAQLDSNKDSAEFASMSLLRKQRELEMEQAYQKRESSLEALKAEGAVANSGVAGNMMGPMYAEIAQKRGRTSAMMAQSLMSAQTETQVGLVGILKDKFNSDMQAWSQKELEPIYAPPPIIPDPTPVTNFVYPDKPGWAEKGPRPILGQVNTYEPPDTGGSSGSILGGIPIVGPIIDALL